MSKELWTDEHIDRVFDFSKRDVYEITMVEHDEAKQALRDVRDDMQQRIDALRAQNARLQLWYMNQQKEDLAEIERLRALLPSGEVIRAIGHMLAMGQAYGKGEKTRERARIVRLWLEKLGKAQND